MTTDPTFFGVQIPLLNKIRIVEDAIHDANTISAILPYDESNNNARGQVSGPALTALLDFSMAASVRAHSPLTHTVATIDLFLKFLKPAESDVYAECTCEHRTNGICIARGVVYDEKGEKIAIANGTFKLIATEQCERKQ
ncbi:hypothetical protein W822_04790 [Advenella kashmirensis W13003]|uniref:Thioesterase domain-containing protein n=1 Tax=Advenella kashmirensis W13003 TaxID=1424334 RepID=V8QZI6_9BURK|nr:PaaI family thioesterase [Advenella kashmirensis]ETF04740.1 hypothetical protein W822_04790 [Advenella kashmirensis W13003]